MTVELDRGTPRPTGARATPADDLARQARKTPEATALSWDGGTWSYRELAGRAAALADRLEALCVVPGQAATLYSPPTSQTVATLFALWRAGCVAMPLHERLTPAEVDHARSLVVSGLHIDNFTFLIRDESGGYDRFPDVIAFILTSGSSGAPRAVGFTRAAFAASAAAAASRLELTAADRWGLCLSLGHIGGLSLVVRAVMTGSSVRLWPSFDAVAVARAVLAGEVTHLAVVPVMLRRLLTRLAGRPIPPTLRCVLVGGAAAPRALLDEAWAAGLPLATTWGMTETASQVATAPPSLARRHPGTAGRPLRCVEVRAGASHPPPAPLQVRGPTLASIVIPGPGAQPEALETDPDGWFSTRDLGRVDPDGLVWIEGRADAMIVSGGLNVSPAEVERVIEGLPGVREAVVFGVPDEEWGEVVAAVVEGDLATVSVEAVDGHCRGRLVRGRCPSRILVVEALPRTWTGKVMRAAAAALLDPAGSGPSPATHPRETT
ncbi:MAG: AMP-binding protein [Gemmatimonadota bacterium]|nr:AMP-binding protein [Gemmatimonadota bacterium]